MGQLKAWDPVLAEWVPVVGTGIDVQDVSAAQEELHASTLIFPDGTVFPQGDGSVRVIDPPSGVIGASISEATVQSLANDTPTALTSNDAEIADTDGFHDTGSNTSRFTIPAHLSGSRPYLVAGTVFFAANATGYRQASIYKGGADQGLQQRNPSISGSVGTYVSIATVIYLTAGEYVELYASQTSTGALNASMSRFSIYRIGSGNVSGLDTARARRTSGDITVNGTSWANLDTGLDLVVPAQAGDVLLMDAVGKWGSEATNVYLDVVTVVSGSPVNSVTTSGAADFGVLGWNGVTGAQENFGGSVQYVVQAGDISGGNVTLRLRVRTSAAVNKVFFAGSGYPFLWNVVNLRGGAASRDIGYEFAYTEFTSTVTVTATTEAGADTVVSAPAVVFDGATAVWIEFFASMAAPDSTGILLITLWDGSTDIGRLLQLDTNAASQRIPGIYGRRKLTPSAGSHTYSIRAWKTVSPGTTTSVDAGAGGAGNVVPGYIRITKA